MDLRKGTAVTETRRWEKKVRVVLYTCNINSTLARLRCLLSVSYQSGANWSSLSAHH